MALIIDPDAAELRALFAAANLAGRRLLEIGSGEGRLTLRYAASAAFVVGVEPDREAVSLAMTARQTGLAHHVTFVAGNGTALPFRAAAFDVALFASSL